MKTTFPRRLGSTIAALAISGAGVLFLPSMASADEVRDKQWYLGALNLAEAHKITKGEGVTIGILDSGVDAAHPDLEGSVLPGTDLFGMGGEGLVPSSDHGTSVASLIVGHDDSDGVLGVAPAAKILSVRITDANGEQQPGMFDDGIRWLADNGADVISMSVADPASDAEGQAAVDYAISKNIVIVAAAGNVRGDEQFETHSTSLYPAAYRGVVGVTGTTSDGSFWDGSVKHGAGLEEYGISAPAKDMQVALRGSGYEQADGTSFAAPIVAGTMALIKAKYPNLNQRQLMERLLLTADDKGDEGEDVEYGWGIVNPLAALTAEVDHYEDPAPTDATTDPAAAPDSGSGGGFSDFVPVLVFGTVLLLVVGVVVLVVRSRRRPAASVPVAPVMPGPPPQPGPDVWRRPPEAGPPPAR